MRGFSMFWLIGGAALIKEIAVHNPSAIGMAVQMRHAGWQGLRFYDLIFPLFIFTSGATVPFSIARLKEKKIPNFQIVGIALKRTIILMIIGVIYNEWHGHQFLNPRLCSVLGQIGASYFICTCIYIANRRSKGLLASIGAIWLLIATLQLLPAKASLDKNINPSNNINSWIDSTFVPGRLLNKSFDPEGPLNWISASSVCLLGAWTSSQLAAPSRKRKGLKRTALKATILGITLIASSLLADNVYPIVKNIWTVPFAALTGGISILFYLLIYYITDIKDFKKPFFMFKVIGANSLVAYISLRFFDYEQFTNGLGAQLSRIFAIDGAIPGILITMIATLSLLYWLYRSKFFVKI